MLLIKRFSLIVPLFILSLYSLARQTTVKTDAPEIFSLKVNQCETLRFSLNSNTIGVSLKQSDNTLGEVVVTAMDVKDFPRN